MGKMYYSEDEASEKLGVAIEKLTELAREGKLQQYQDGPKKVYQAQQVEDLALTMTSTLQDSGEIELAPADTAAGDSISLTAADTSAEVASKEDTVITADGVSIFDDEDLDIEAADPMAKTQIAPSLEDQISEGASSGSGLLDLTRESDDTSLGAEVLDNINVESGIGAGLDTGMPVTPYAQAAEQVPSEIVTIVEPADPNAGLFTGFAVGCAIVAMLLSVVMLSVMTGKMPDIVETMKAQLFIVVGATAGLIVICGVVGLMMGKSAARRELLSSAGG